VEVAEGDVHGNEDDIGWVAEEVTPEFNSLTENKGPCCQCDQKCFLLISRPLLSRFEPRVEDEAIVGEGPCSHCRLKDGISAPWLGPVL